MKRLIIITALLALSVSSYAEQWQILGTRPMGMGGAFVAVAQGPIAQYWNPGGLVKSAANVSGMEIPVGVNAEFTGNIIENASQIGDMADKFSAIQTSQRGGTPVGPEQMSAFVKTLTLMNDMNDPGKGALFEIAGGVNFKFSKVALSVNNFTSMGLNPTIDVINIGLSNVGGVSGIKFTAYNQSSLDNASYTSAAGTLKTSLDGLGASLIPLLCGTNNCTTLDGGVNGITDTTQLANAIANFANANGITPAQLLDAASTISQYSTEAQPLITAGASGAPYSENTSNLTVAGASFMEIAAGYAWDMKMLSGLSLGANLKMINGRTALTSFHFLSEGDTKDAFTLEDTKSSWRPAADVGLLWNVRSKYPNFPLRPKIGLVIRNINSPRFDMPVDGDYKLKRQARLGFALNPARFWTLALDMDLTKNKTPVSGFNSRQLCMGMEINIFNRKAFNIPLRAGLMKNLAEKDSKAAFTFGTGLNLLYMHLDVSGVVSSDRTEIDGDEYPTKVGLAASFGLLF